MFFNYVYTKKNVMKININIWRRVRREIFFLYEKCCDYMSCPVTTDNTHESKRIYFTSLSIDRELNLC